MVDHRVKREGSPTRKLRTKPNLILEVLPEEQQSDNGGGDEEATIYAAMAYYADALAAVSFDEEPAPHRTLWFSVFGFWLWLKGLLLFALSSVSWVIPVISKIR